MWVSDLGWNIDYPEVSCGSSQSLHADARIAVPQLVCDYFLPNPFPIAQSFDLMLTTL
jgi:hypothetical protein